MLESSGPVQSGRERVRKRCHIEGRPFCSFSCFPQWRG